MNRSYFFKCLGKEEVDECSFLISSCFTTHDPFIKDLNIDQKEFYEKVRKQIIESIDDQTIVICVSNDRKIIGCFAGFKWSSNYFEESLSSKKNMSLNITFTNEMSGKEKYEILESIETTLLQEHYEKRKSQRLLDKCLFCDYYCISKEYFQSNLSLELIYNFHVNAKQKNIKYTYGLFSNPKAIQLVIKNLPFKILKEVTVYLKKEDHEEEVKLYLLMGEMEKIDVESISKNKPKL